MSEERFEELADKVDDLEKEKVSELVDSLIEADEDPEKIVEKGLARGLRRVGEKFNKGEYFLADMTYAANIMEENMGKITPLLKDKDREKVGKVVIGTVEDDIHSIGKDLVIALMRGAGLDVVDLGVEVPASDFVDAVRKHDPHAVGMSALLTTTAPHFKDVIEELEEEGLRDDLFVMIGGPPHMTAEEAGADFYSNNAFEAVDKVVKIVGEKKGTS